MMIKCYKIQPSVFKIAGYQYLSAVNLREVQVPADKWQKKSG